MFQDPTFWVAISFVLFAVLVFKPLGKFLSSTLDGRSLRIQTELNEALRLKEEAQALLSSYQRKHKEATDEAKKILKNAENESKRIAIEAESNLEESLNKKIQMAMQKISTYENSVMQEVRTNSIDLTISTVRNLIKENIDDAINDDLVINALNDMNKKLH
jgi:F-type H+-transporting ATPase subunit b